MKQSRATLFGLPNSPEAHCDSAGISLDRSIGRVRNSVDRNDTLVVARQIVGDVFKGQERSRVHQELAEQERRSPGLPQDAHGLLRGPRAGVV
jgi:hypothetical protein